MSTSLNLIEEIRSARCVLRTEENRTHEAAIELRNCKEREKRAKGELDALLDELETGQSRYPLPGFDRMEIPDPTPDPAVAAPANGRGRKKP